MKLAPLLIVSTFSCAISAMDNNNFLVERINKMSWKQKIMAESAFRRFFTAVINQQPVQFSPKKLGLPFFINALTYAHQKAAQTLAIKATEHSKTENYSKLYQGIVLTLLKDAHDYLENQMANQMTQAFSRIFDDDDYDDVSWDPS